MSDKLTAQLQKMEKQFEGLKKEFASDGKVTRDEVLILKTVQDKLQDVRKRVVERSAKNGVVDFTDEPAAVSSGVKPYDDAVFKAAFEQSIKDWSQDGNIALNRVKTYFMKGDKPKGLGVTEILGVVSWAVRSNPAAAAFMGTVKLTASLVQAAYKASLPATPSLNEIHSAWATALGKYGSISHQREFQQFIADYKKNNKVGPDVFEVPQGLFLPACADYAKNYLPQDSVIEKAFLTKILSKVDDSFDIDLAEGLDKSGVAEVTMMHLVGNFSSPEGQLDDVSSSLLQAIQTVWAKQRVIDLPVQVYFKLVNSNGANMCEVQRMSRKSGDTNFTLRSGKKEIFEDFMKSKAYSIPYVKHLKLDY